MATNEIASFLSAKYILDSRREINIPVKHLSEVMSKVSQFAMDLSWAPFQSDLIQLHSRLEHYRRVVCVKTKAELEELEKTPFPASMKKELEDLASETPVQIQQKVAKMLSNSDWASFHAQLMPLKLRVDNLSKNAALEKIDRVGIINLISSIITPLRHERDLIPCPTRIARDFNAGNIERMKQHIEDSPQVVNMCIVVDGVSVAILNYACTYKMPISNQLSLIKLLIRAGANVNFQAVEDYLLTGSLPPLCIPFHTGSDDIIPVKSRQKILQLLLDSGANPNLSTISYDPGINHRVIHSLIRAYCRHNEGGSGVEHLLPLLVDAGMDVNSPSVLVQSNGTNEVFTPLMLMLQIGCRLEFIKDLIFNNAIAHEAARKKAQEKGCLQYFDKYVHIRDSVVLGELTPAVRTYLIPLVTQILVEVVVSYWTPNVSEMRARCYALLPIDQELIQLEETVKQQWKDREISNLEAETTRYYDQYVDNGHSRHSCTIL